MENIFIIEQRIKGRMDAKWEVSPDRPFYNREYAQAQATVDNYKYPSSERRVVEYVRVVPADEQRNRSAMEE